MNDPNNRPNAQPPQAGAPAPGYPQGQVHPGAYPPPGYPQQGNGHPHQGYPQQGAGQHPPPGYPQQGNGHPQQGYPPGYGQPQAYPPQPGQAYPTYPQGQQQHPAQGYPPGHPQAYPLAVRPQPGAVAPYQQPGYPGYPGYPQHGQGHHYPPPPINVVVQNNMVPYGQHALVKVADRNKWVATLLAFFVGGFGGHKFYLGNTGAGVVYLLFFWTGVPFFISFIEMLILAMMSEREFEVRYNTVLAR